MDARFHDLLIIDDIYPSSFSPFRTLEYNHYLWFFDAAVLATQGSQLWIENTKLTDHVAQLAVDEKYKKRIFDFRESDSIGARLAYITFLSNAYKLLPYLMAKKLPFILQLYPGGGFAVDQEETDAKLREVLHSPLCRKVLTTQTITTKYITEKIGCDPAKIEFIFGGVFDSRVDFDYARDKKRYGFDKQTIDLCFVAHKYGDDLVSKGYDYFVRVAKSLSERFEHVRFHVVGDYRPQDIPLDGAEKFFHFYGRQESAFFAGFYPSMDAIVSFNRPFVLMPGAFDGFPTGACLEAGFRGVANLINDPLQLNQEFVDGVDLLLLDEDFDKTIRNISALIQAPERLFELGAGTCKAYRRVMDLDRQLWRRSKLIGDELLKHRALVAVGWAPRSTMDAEPVRLATAELQARVAQLEGRDTAPPLPPQDEQRVSELEHENMMLRDEVRHWRLMCDRLASGIPHRIFEKTKTIVRRYRNRSAI